MADKTGREVAQILENFANGCSREDMEEFVGYITNYSHRTLQQKIFGIFCSCIQAWAKCVPTGYFDLRNEATVKLCEKITKKFDKYDMALPYV